MGTYSTIILPDTPFESLKTKEDLYAILNEEERDFLDRYYGDLEVEDGYLGLDAGFIHEGYYRKNYERHFWISILKKIAIKERNTFQVMFLEDSYCEASGYKAYRDGTVKKLVLNWVEIDLEVELRRLLK